MKNGKGGMSGEREVVETSMGLKGGGAAIFSFVN